MQRACRSMSLTLDRGVTTHRDGFALSGVPTGPIPVVFSRVFVRYA
jgi:hypothetical protein